MFHQHSLVNAPNAYSVHSWLGLVMFTIFTFQFLQGLITYGFPGLAVSVRKWTMPHHKFFGRVTFCLGIAAIVTGVFDKQRFLPSDGGVFTVDKMFANILTLFAGSVGVSVMFLISDTISPHNPEYQPVKTTREDEKKGEEDKAV